MIKRWGWLTLLFVHSIMAQQVQGVVKDATAGAGLPGALVYLNPGEYGTVTDENGVFRFSNIPAGYYQIQVRFVGYAIHESTIQIKPGITNWLTFELTPTGIALEGVEIVEKKELLEVGKRSITEEQVYRFAATYYDPARLMTTSPAVTVSNDQHNQLSVRGISPDLNTWWLEGTEIVNPNHLSNAGTFTDQPSGTGGGVNIISAQMLQTATLHYGAMSGALGNTTAGLMDLTLKTGNPNEKRWMGQASFIGFDLASDGPISKAGKTTYSLNYLYSFTGLLTTFGVDFGGERIGFQDLAINLYRPLGKHGHFKVFGIGGANFNKFDHLPISLSERYKDRQDIYFKGTMGMAGISLRWKGWALSSTLSGFENTRTQTNYELDRDVLQYAFTTQTDRKMHSTHVRHRMNVGQWQFQHGIFHNRYLTLNRLYEVTRAYHHTSYYPFSKLKLTFDLAAIGSTETKWQIEPRFGAELKIHPVHILSGGVGRYAQFLVNSPAVFSPDPFIQPSLRDPELISAVRYTVDYTYRPAWGSIQLELFHYEFDQMPAPDFANILSVDWRFYTRGMSIQVQRDFKQGFYLTAGAARQQSEFFVMNQPNDSRYNFTAATGKRIEFENSRVLQLNLRTMWHEGNNDYAFYRSQPIDIFDPPQLERMKDYRRTDIRIQYEWAEKRPQWIALDLQNVFNRQNEAFTFFDPFIGANQQAVQLGFIPNFTYRVMF